MSGLFSSIGRKGLFLVDAEKAHGLSVAALKSGFLPTCMVPHDPRLQQTVAGLVFPNPLGMAAGYDKNAEVPGPLLRLGFGFTEIGTVTPRGQSGNPKPRIFRLVEDEGVINRLGFNNEGHAAALERLKQAQLRGIVGVNIGANKDSEDRIADYVRGIEAFIRSHPISPSTSLRPIRRVCVTCRRAKASRHFLAPCWSAAGQKPNVLANAFRSS